MGLQGASGLKACHNWQYAGALPGFSFHNEASETPHLQEEDCPFHMVTMKFSMVTMGLWDCVMRRGRCFPTVVFRENAAFDA